MYICLCKAVTDHQIKDAIQNGHCTRKQLIECFGVGRDCGKCHQDVAALLHYSRETTSLVSQSEANFFN